MTMNTEYIYNLSLEYTVRLSYNSNILVYDFFST